MIFYFCPDTTVKSGGIRRIYRHVEVLSQNDFPAAVMHEKKGFSISDLPAVPIRYFNDNGVLNGDDILVIPEGFPGLMKSLQNLPIRRFVFALSWSHIYRFLPDGEDWRDYGIERILTILPFIKDFLTWTMNLPVDLLDFSIDPQLYYYQENEKELQVTYFQRKSADTIEPLKNIMKSRNKEFMSKIKWVGLHDLPLEEFAAEIRKSMIFLSLGTMEGLNRTVYESMRSGTLVAGFNGVGLQDVMKDDGEEKNCILAQNGDYVTLARKLEPFFLDMLSDRTNNWQKIIRNGRRVSVPHTMEAEEKSIVNFWNSVL